MFLALSTGQGKSLSSMLRFYQNSKRSGLARSLQNEALTSLSPKGFPVVESNPSGESFAFFLISKSFDIHIANKTPQRRPAVVMPGKGRMLHSTNLADSLCT
jgi:hypothetical protein